MTVESMSLAVPRDRRRIVKVGLVGTSCVGKSTLLDDLTMRLNEECVPVGEAARVFFSPSEYYYQPSMGGRFSVAVQGRVQAMARRNEVWGHHYAGEVCSRLGRAAIVCDRTVFDAPVYVASQGDENGAHELLERAYGWTKQRPYDLLYVLDPAAVPYVTDEIRTEPPETRQLFHDTYLTFFNEHGIDYELLGGTRAQRVETVSTAIMKAYDL